MATTTDRVEQATGADEHAPPGEDRPLAAYAGLTAAFGLTLGGGLLASRATGRELPERPAAADLVLIGLATHKVTRLLAKDRVTAFLRAPFTRYQEPSGHGEVEEAPRHRAAPRAGRAPGLPVLPGAVGRGRLRRRPRRRAPHDPAPGRDVDGRDDLGLHAARLLGGREPVVSRRVADLALLSDSRTAALVDREGEVCWWPGPRFDGPSVFSSLLDDDAGRFRIAPTAPVREVRRA